ncbi:MAG: hypothetical protein AB7O65_06690 [Candidatus Korobacteraceae bacterium]
MRRMLSILALGMALSSSPAFGQGCAMCWTSANGADSGGKRALNRAVTMLLVPTLGLMAGFVVLAVRYGKRDDDPGE